MNTEVLNKYIGQKLGITGSLESGGDYYVKDFLDQEMLMYFICELVSHDTDLTKLGYQFLEEYYGLENLANTIDKEYPNFSNSQDIGQTTLEWLKTKGEFAV